MDISMVGTLLGCGCSMISPMLCKWLPSMRHTAATAMRTRIFWPRDGRGPRLIHYTPPSCDLPAPHQRAPHATRYPFPGMQASYDETWNSLTAYNRKPPRRATAEPWNSPTVVPAALRLKYSDAENGTPNTVNIYLSVAIRGHRRRTPRTDRSHQVDADR